MISFSDDREKISEIDKIIADNPLYSCKLAAMDISGRRNKFETTFGKLQHIILEDNVITINTGRRSRKGSSFRHLPPGFFTP